MAHTQTNTYGFRRHAHMRSVTGLGNLIARVIGQFMLWQERAGSRADLRRLNDRMLKDIGLNRVDALREADKPFWKR